MWTDVESYRRLEREYQLALERYNREEALYRELLTQNPDDPTLSRRYEQLEQLREQLQSLFKRLADTRGEIATTREKSSLGFGA